ncbi:MAG: ribosome maturation factor RimP [Candidatus Riflebacteria bacterium]|nr:ribosome maturation factor RimP [Candidatus Riflebacteria bacterium]
MRTLPAKADDKLEKSRFMRLSVNLRKGAVLMEELTQQVIDVVWRLVEEKTPYEVYDVAFRQMNRQMVLTVYIDSPDGITIRDCETVSRTLSDYLDQNDLIHRAYTLEVSSPGIERLFKRQVDYERHVGKLVKWRLYDKAKKKKEVFQARLQQFSPEKIVVSTEKGLREFELGDVLEARAVFEFPAKPKKKGKKG